VKKIATVIALILLFACSKQEQLSAQAEADIAAPKAAAAPPPARMIVRNASLHIVVADTARAVDDVTASVQSLGGYLAGSEVWHEGELLRARLTLRVPSAQLSPALAAIRKLSRRVENETVTSEDVSQQYTDLGSQLRNLEATEAELRELLTTVRKNARKASEILEVHQQLVSIRGEIEVTKGRMQHLSRTAELSQIALEVMPDAITKPVAEGEWQPVVIVKNASRALLGALRGIAAALIWLVIYVVPICGIMALVAGALVAIARRLRRGIA
jgi:Domain of unknown function (DUF4349)